MLIEKLSELCEDFGLQIIITTLGNKDGVFCDLRQMEVLILDPGKIENGSLGFYERDEEMDYLSLLEHDLDLILEDYNMDYEYKILVDNEGSINYEKAMGIFDHELTEFELEEYNLETSSSGFDSTEVLETVLQHQIRYKETPLYKIGKPIKLKGKVSNVIDFENELECFRYDYNDDTLFVFDTILNDDGSLWNVLSGLNKDITLIEESSLKYIVEDLGINLRQYLRRFN